MAARRERGHFADLAGYHPTRNQLVQRSIELPVDRRRRAVRRNIAEHTDHVGVGSHLGDASANEIDLDALAPLPRHDKIAEQCRLPSREDLAPILHGTWG